MQQGPPTASESLECHLALGFLLDPSGLCVRLFDVVRVILNISQITSPLDKLILVWSSCSARVQKLSVSQTHLSSDDAAKAGSRQTALTLWTQPKQSTQLYLSCISCLHFLLPRPGWTQFLWVGTSALLCYWLPLELPWKIGELHDGGLLPDIHAYTEIVLLLWL